MSTFEEDIYIDDVTYEITPDGTTIATVLFSDGTCVQVEADSVEEADIILLEEGVQI